MEGPSDSEGRSLLPTAGGEAPGAGEKLRVYRWRWYILVVITLLNISNGALASWFQPVADTAAEFYSVELSEMNWLSLAFLLTAVPLGFVATWVLDVIGLRAGIIIGAWIQAAGAGITAISTLHDIPPSYRFAVVVAGQVVAAMAQPLLRQSPAKVAAMWFADDQRATANMIISMGSPIGSILSNLVGPQVAKSGDRHSLQLLVSLYTIVPCLTVLMATFGICSSGPPSPPSISAAKGTQPFFPGLKMLCRDVQYWILMLTFGAGMGTFQTFVSVIEQVFCPRGYTDTFAGICAALMVLLGMVGAGAAGRLVDRTKRFEEIIKLSAAIGTLALIVFAVLSNYPGKEVPLAISASVFGVTAFAMYPTALELSVEITYPVSAATSSGLLIVCGNLQAIILTFLAKYIPPPLPPSQTVHAHCGKVVPRDFKVMMLIFAGWMTVASVTLLLGLKPVYKRLQVERTENKSVNAEQPAPST
ncbi:solute carrier family 49 member A3-like [Branchiostoma floridae x Branchiostoma japonicum]